MLVAPQSRAYRRDVTDGAPTTPDAPADDRVEVTTTTLEQLTPDDLPAARPLPPAARIELVTDITPEFLRWLYATVGGPWRWVDRLGWPRDRWAAELAEPGSEVWVVYTGGAPAGYLQLGATHDPERGGAACEIRYFGLQEWAIGRGIGGPFLTRGIELAWSLADRHDLPGVTRVWVHTCTLDGPAALPNYEARGLRIVGTEATREAVPAEPAGAWAAMGGPGGPDRTDDTDSADGTDATMGR